MTRNIKAVALIMCFVLLAGCAADDDEFVVPTAERMARVTRIIGIVDWSQVELMTLRLDEFDFAPADLTFRRNQPYELTITNKGFSAHNFVAPAFFEAVAVNALVYVDGESSMPLLQSIAFEAGETKTLIFVPLRPGEYPLVCDRPLHDTFGMLGKIRIP